MRLPAHPRGGVQIGISDILAWRDCATRMAEGMKRHSGQEAPESWSPENAYGSAVHLALSLLDQDTSPEQAAQAAFAQFKQWLEPSDLTLLHEDMIKYLDRDILGVRTLLNEDEIAIALFVHPTAGQVWFRARIDRLYQSLTDPSTLVHVDYKSSKHAKSHDEVAKDLQLWGYNLVILGWFEDTFPEVERPRLEQVYDQLRYGQIPTSKNAEQRQEMRRWLITAITAIIDDEEIAPSFNQWCPWCHLKLDCPVVQYQLTDWATTRIAALMPREQRLNKNGSVSKRPGPVVLDPERLSEYVELLPQVKRAATVLQKFDETVTETLKQMTDSDVNRLGKRKVERSTRVFSTEAKRRIIEEVGLPTALMLFELSIAGIQRFFASDKELGERIASYAEKQPAYTVIEDITA